jgi:hypothetical protein
MKPSSTLDAIGSVRFHVAAFLCLILIPSGFVQAQPSYIPTARTILDINRWDSAGPFGEFGEHILSLGDFNRDGWPDIIASGDPIYSHDTNVLFGGPSILDDTTDVFLRGGGVMTSGDFNGDGLKDLAVYASTRDPHGRDTVFVYYGCSTCRYVLDTIPSTTITVNHTNAPFNFYLVAADFNRDGYDDLVMRTSEGDTLRPTGGRIYIYMGRPGLLNENADFSGHKDVFGGYYGEMLQIGDVNGDGYPDLCGRSLFSSRPPWPTVDVYHGGPDFKFDATKPDQQIDSRELRVPFPFPEMLVNFSILDLNNDGIADLYFMDSVSAHIIYGLPAGFGRTPDRSMKSPAPGVYSIYDPVKSIGDINGDGYGDFTIGALYYESACLLIYLGGKRGLSEYPCGVVGHPRDWWDFGRYNTIGLGDIDGDGVNDFATSGFDDRWYWYIRIVSGSRKYVLDVEHPPNASTLAQAYPNPFRTKVLIRVPTEGSESATVSIYNVRGELLRRLDGASTGTDDCVVLWDGRSEKGDPASPGIYYGVAQDGRKLSAVRIVRY